MDSDQALPSLLCLLTLSFVSRDRILDASFLFRKARGCFCQPLAFCLLCVWTTLAWNVISSLNPQAVPLESSDSNYRENLGLALDTLAKLTLTGCL